MSERWLTMLDEQSRTWEQVRLINSGSRDAVFIRHGTRSIGVKTIPMFAVGGAI
jgi:hypothetical protein